jgi:hypothetical protein
LGPGPSRLGPGWTRRAWWSRLGPRRTAAARLAPLIEVLAINRALPALSGGARLLLVS